MKLSTARKMGEELIGIYCHQYTFRYHPSKNVFGRCEYRNKVLSFSRQMVLLNTEDRVRRVILHEIAHALTPNHGHDRIWYEKCAELGIPDETRCWEHSDTLTLPKKYISVCPTCNKEIGLNRLKKRVKQWYCGSCKNPITLYPNIEYFAVQHSAKNAACKKGK